MSTPHEKALFYANGKPRVAGKTQKQIKADKKEHDRTTPFKGLRAGDYKTDTSNTVPKKDRFGWAGKVGEAHRRNQPAKHEGGYREDYR